MDRIHSSTVRTLPHKITNVVFHIVLIAVTILALESNIIGCLAKQSSLKVITRRTNPFLTSKKNPTLNPTLIRGGASSPSTNMYETEEITNDQPNKMSSLSLKQNKIEFVFSDVDGTLVHFPEQSSSDENEDILQLPTSSTGMQGVISCQSLKLCQQLRSKGVKLILVSGMRTSTLFKRLPYLPRADAYACEAGGRIFFPVPLVNNDNTDNNLLLTIHPQPFNGVSEESFGIVEDLEWRSSMSHLEAAGADGYCDDAKTNASQRSGLLWDFARTLLDKGFVIDSNGYASCFRVNKRQQDSTKITEEDFENLKQICQLGSLPDGLATSVNLGCVDFYPKQSGKKNCCAYLAKHFSEKTKAEDDGSSLLAEKAVCMCDDDNDLQMARACSKAYVPGITSNSMLHAVNQQPDQFVVTENKDQNIVETFATEAALSTILNQLLTVSS